MCFLLIEEEDTKGLKISTYQPYALGAFPMGKAGLEDAAENLVTWL